MGIHHWTGYVGHEEAACEGLKQMLDLFCFNCHTPDDVGGCHRCEIGCANMMMLRYIQHNFKPNKDIKLLSATIDNEDEFYRFIRLRSHFRPKKPDQKYVNELKQRYKKELQENSIFIGMLGIWAANNQECAEILALIEKIKKAPKKY